MSWRDVLPIHPAAELFPLMSASATFEQAKNPTRDAQFLQIVAKPKAARMKSEPKLTRVAFKVSRLMEFCSERELQNQTGHALYDWPLVVGKEAMDNALDAAEEAEVAPTITVIVELYDPGLQPGGLCLSDPRRARQRAQNHSRHGLRTRSQDRQECQSGGDHDHRNARSQA